jgi:hypothetical protein
MRCRYGYAAGLLATVAMLFNGVPAHAQVTRPPAPNQLSFTVSASATQNKKTKIWTYSFTVRNSSGSMQPLSEFAVAYNPPISNIQQPSNWLPGDILGRNVFHWGAIGGSFAPGTDDGGIPPSPHMIAPGASLSGFSFQSPNPPVTVPAYALGFVPLASGPSESEAEDIADQCAPVLGNFFDEAVLGASSGPGGVGSAGGNRRSPSEPESDRPRSNRSNRSRGPKHRLILCIKHQHQWRAFWSGQRASAVKPTSGDGGCQRRWARGPGDVLRYSDRSDSVRYANCYPDCVSRARRNRSGDRLDIDDELRDSNADRHADAVSGACRRHKLPRL